MFDLSAPVKLEDFAACPEGNMSREVLAALNIVVQANAQGINLGALLDTLDFLVSSSGLRFYVRSGAA